MKKELSTEDLIVEVFMIGFAGILLSFLFGFLINAFLFYCVMPYMLDFIPSMEEYFKHLSVEDATAFYDVFHEGCVFVGFFPAMLIASGLPRSRRERFTKETAGLWSAKDGFFYHLKNYWIFDMLIAIIFVFVFFAISFHPVGISPFSIVYRFCGRAIGFIISLIIVIAFQMIGIISAQNRWSAQYYVDDI